MFDIKKHLIKVQGGRQYLPVASRLIWFRTEHPDWGIDTKAIAIDIEKQYAVFEASVYNADGKLMAKGTKMENVRGFGDWLEKAETGAIGRALAVCGYGTQFAPDLDESHEPMNSDFRSDQSPQYKQNYQNGRDSRNIASASGFSIKSTSAADGLSLVKTESSTSDNQKNAGQSAGQLPQSEKCDSCSATLSTNQLSLSLRKYGTALCPDCQKKRKSEQAA